MADAAVEEGGVAPQPLGVRDPASTHPEVVSAHQRIGNVHYQRNDLAAANREYRKALSIYQHFCGAVHSTT